ncbi:FMN-dependent monooxygenase [Ktedonobacter sp. SOSP1-85]|uniref:LLM class F420-dependent oxidoreductase n=1 Tax=Ktedonobacter sp. SOSP1-85 TaxID=2778367 RepID=UPI0019168B85|nr:LLM class F420-dependent oxidoreductase [Ktedonobacter sp. SOSP1-85]GHO74011.1 FMN-dependent monooxygenase [Ktedonobacter sp. SOSP1-85]
MKLAIQFGVSTYTSSNEDWASALTYAVEAERLGIDSAWTAETWGYDGATPLAYLAAKTTRIRLGTGILQVGTRTPALTAMTAMALASLSGDRFLLGLGVSGPQVIEGWHGVRFARPLQRLRETVEIVRQVTRGERLVYHGEAYQIPLPEGEGKALTSSVPARPGLPVYLATLGPKSLELTGELADGWLGTSFIPEHASLFFDPIAAGAAQAGRTIADLDLQVAAGVVAFSDDVESLIVPRKPGLAFTLGAMGSRRHNFYNDVYRRAGYADVALVVQDLWFKKQREAAASRIPDELILKTNLIGTENMVRERLRAHRRAGVNTLQVDPAGQTLDERLATLARLVELVKEINAEP